MNWKVVIQLSLLGLAMGIATVFFISSSAEPLYWLVILGFSAAIIAVRCPGRYFVHGVMLGLANSVWVTAAHVLLFDRYIASHPDEAAMMSSMPLPDSPRLMMACVGPVIGLASGVVIGLFAVVAAKLTGRQKAAAHSS